ncbi:MAG: hypothetical protein KAI24_05930, partial [Planctomycetes bacterium]|nr:hypothetical protein [Planctomycetota bacterium]
SALLDPMQTLSNATSGLRTAIADRDRAAFGDHLDAIEAALPSLAKAAAKLPRPIAAAAAIDALRAAARDLRHPVGDGVASDRWDLSRLRGACTACHAHNRPDNADRGLFPNMGGAVAGRVALLGRDGDPIDDRSGVVVFLERDDDRPEPRPRPPAISQRGCRFEPAVLAVTVGTTVRFPNDDVVFHNVFSLSRGNTFDLGTYGKGKEKQRVFDKPGLIKVHCNIHAAMASHVLVLNSERHAVTNTDGTWCIPDVPPGQYSLRVWHALADGQRRPLEVGNALIDAALEVRETKTRAPHTDKHGRRYRKKY